METGKEIYKEYVKECLDDPDFPDCSNVNNRWQVLISSSISESAWVGCHPSTFYRHTDFIGIRRAPKTQMINGHEVVAPCYDMPESGQRIYIYYPLYEDGVLATSYVAEYIKHGWFDNEKDALAYAKAHRESK